MNERSLLILMAVAAAVPAAAQPMERRAGIIGGGGPGGRCTIEVVVDGTAEVEVRGDNAVLRNLGGQLPQWRRFECTSPLPPNPADFRFRGVDGRGRQQLVRDPRSGGSAVVRIEDPQGGADRYKFDLLWSGFNPGRPDRDRDFDRDRDRDRDADRDRGRDADRGGDRDADRGGDREEAYHREREGFYRGDEWRQRFFQHVREDVEHVRTVSFPFGGDQYRLARTLQELDELQDKMARRYYDERELNDVMDALGRVLRDNRLAPRDRDVLSDDLNRMRDFREHHADWGVR
ncbi:MAG TPA: hypothetical protein VKX49_21105 [Bryobacteraceae bacterium]|nr:hypothetical protein [Bryobacteraceae bacterium]